MGEKRPDKKNGELSILDYSAVVGFGWEETLQQRSEDYQEKMKAQYKQRLEEHQEDVKADEAQRILDKKEVTSKDIEEVFKDYAEDEKNKQYLVSGAVLTCDQATWAPFPLPGGDCITVGTGSEEGKYAYKYPFPTGELSIPDGDMFVNNELNATVADTVMYKNIFPFQCNCKITENAATKMERIRNDPLNSILGVCRHFMSLNDEWDNLPLEGQSYKTKEIVKDKSAGEEEKNREDTRETVKVPCITMTSALFCKHGGLITPVTSGQENKKVCNMSDEGKRALFYCEILNEYAKSEGILVIEDGYLVAVKPHLVSDGSITIGAGDWIAPDDLQYYKDKGIELYLPDKYDDESSYAEKTIKEAYEKIKDYKIKTSIVLDKYDKDLEAVETIINSYIQDKGILLNQRQYDTIIIMRYQMGSLSKGDEETKITDLLENNNWDEAEWEKAINERRGNSEKNRTEWELSILFGEGEYPVETEAFRGLTEVKVREW